MAGKPVVTVNDSGVRVSCRSSPPEKDFFMALWLVGWTAGELGVTWTIFFGDGEARLFLILWLVPWTAGGLFAWYNYLWPRIGLTVLEVDDSRVRIKKVLGPIEFNKNFHRMKVQNFRPASWSVLFEHEGKKLSFGEALDRDDIRHILAAIRQKYPEMVKPTP
jgi:hypothetical protein